MAVFLFGCVRFESSIEVPGGDFDEAYGRNNLPYLDRAMDEAEEDSDWAYRLYVCFSGAAPECAAPVWHCVPSYRFGRPEPDESFAELDDPSSPVHGHARRLA